jgi:hypothetical protein
LNSSHLAGFLADVRATYLSEPDETVASRHLEAIAREYEATLPRRAPDRDWWRKSIANRFVRRDVRP